MTITGGGTGLTYTPAADYNGPDSFTYTVCDNGTTNGVADPQCATGTVTVTVTSVNDPPVAVNDTYVVNEDATLTVGAPGVLGNDHDVDGDALTAILVTGPQHGTLTLNTLNADGSFTYTPNASFNGQDSFTYKANDGTIDSNTATVTITVAAGNAVPVAQNDNYNTPQDQALMVAAPGVLGNDNNAANGGALTAVLVTGPQHGALTLNTLNADGSFTYTPNANFNGQDSFTYKANDGTTDSNTATVTITVTGANDGPVAMNDNYNTPEDQALTVVAPGVLDNDVGGNPLTAVLVTGPLHGALTLNADGSFTYTPNANFNGQDSFTYKANDGTTDSQNVAMVAITVTPVNDAPTADDKTVTVEQDTPQDIPLTGSDVETCDLTFTIVSPPSHGGLSGLTNMACVAGTPNTDSAQVTYTPASGYTGPDSFTYKVTDTGDGVAAPLDSPVATVTITVALINHAPSFTKGPDQTVLEDAGAQSVPNWATNISAGPANESGQTLTFQVTGNTNSGLFAAGPSVAANGTLTYTPADNANGTATITLVLKDDGGTANGGQDTSPPQSFTITVTAVNDAPSFTKGADQTVNEDAGPQTVANWATNISAGPANEVGQVVNFIVSNDNNGLFAVQPAVSASGTLTYTLAANQNGVATVSVQIHDNGGTANGGVDTSAVQTFTITVTAVNDPPVAENKSGIQVQANMKRTGIDAGLLTNVTDADSGVNGCSPTFAVASITSGSGGTVSNVNLAAGTFDFDPDPGFTGTAVVNYTVSDDGCPGSATSAPATISITVNGPVIWFVDSSVTGPGDGRLSNPFKFLSGNAGANNDADDVDAANHHIFLFSSATTYTGGLTLNSGESLIGQGVTDTTFDAFFGINPPAGTITRPTINGTRPTVGGTVTLAGNATVRGLNLSTGSSTGLSGGSVTGVTVSEVSVTTTTGTAVNLNGTGGTVSLTSVSANGGTNGIVLTNTTGSFTVTGMGGAGTGGTIQNTTGNGISLNNAQNISLSSMNIQNNDGSGVFGDDVTNFSIIGSSVTGNGDALDGSEAGLRFNELLGTSAITNTTVSNSSADNVRLTPASGTLNLTVSGSTFGPTTGGSGFSVVAINTANVTVTVTNSTFTDNSASGFLTSFANTSAGTFNISNSTFTATPPSFQNMGIDLGISDSSDHTFTLSNNTLLRHASNAINIVTSGNNTNASQYRGTISGNCVGGTFVGGVCTNNQGADAGSRDAFGIAIDMRGDVDAVFAVTNNGVFHTDIEAIFGQSRLDNDGDGEVGLLDLTLTGNIGGTPDDNSAFPFGNVYGMRVESRNTTNLCLDIANNDANGVGTFEDTRLRQRDTSTFRLERFVGNGALDTDVESFLLAQNPLIDSADATHATTFTGVANGTCRNP